ncbi:MAG TPA: DUF427 domain-containing protein [Candidatus Tumulicola sp.]|nr:DUF427 domain-containing protein [Candidatus Tumulicola sp.]
MSRSRIARVEPGPGQESAWDYPRPPRLEVARARLRVVLGGVTIADTTAGVRILETSHPPNYYFPRADVRADALQREAGSSWCEWKGQAHYYTVRAGDRLERRAAWSYAKPNPAYRELAGMVAFYPALMDACFVDDELVRAQPGGFYGGWITNDVVGPFKGAPGSHGW